MPESQWPASLPTQQGIAFDLFREALAIGSNVAINDKAIAIATKRVAISRPQLLVKSFFPQRRRDAKEYPSMSLDLCAFAGKNFMMLIRIGGGLLNDWFPNQFHLALGTYSRALRYHLLVHRADIVELSRLFGMRRSFLLCCTDRSHRIYTRCSQKQCGREQR